MSQICYFRCARCGELVSVSYSSYAEDGAEPVRELEATDKCFSCGYVPFRVRDIVSPEGRDLAVVEWP